MTVSEEMMPVSHELPWPLHRLPVEVDPAELPVRFTCPFHYTPHPLCIAAASSVQAYLAARAEWHDELAAGKMFGVLVVRRADGDVGFLAAFSGNLAASNHHAYFVPPVYDMLQPDGFFLREDRAISMLNEQVAALERDAAFMRASEELHRLEHESSLALGRAHDAEVRAHEERERLRAQAADAADLEKLIHESQHDHAVLHQLKRLWSDRIAAAEAAVAPTLARLEELRAERHRRSAALQHRLFSEFRMRNARGEVRDLNAIFASTSHRVPPAGAGECAAPKLLQYAFVEGLHPVAMAEFWWGASPRTEERRQGEYYPACSSKCGPILRFMLQGLDVEPNPLEEGPSDL